jgi:hypothetical protein
MAADTPLSRLALGAASVADDLGYVALNDLALALEDVTADYRVIGGHMVTTLAARWRRDCINQPTNPEPGSSRETHPARTKMSDPNVKINAGQT